ncbi:hypothetical protein, partial [Xanthomonas graminis]|uniref:hypothetical protein n=1 Tax=Xanthomonas graminis TaxID=3390026 RepID=UPI001C8F485E
LISKKFTCRHDENCQKEFSEIHHFPNSEEYPGLKYLIIPGRGHSPVAICGRFNLPLALLDY